MSSYASTRDALVLTAKRIGITFPVSVLADFEHSPITTLCTMVGILDESQLFPAGMIIDPKLRLAMILVSSCSFFSVLGSDAKKVFLLETSSQQSTTTTHLRNILASQNTFSKYSGIAVSMFVDAHDMNLMNVVLALEPLLERTEMLLSLGGDDRLTIDFNGTKINKYFSSTLPRAEMIRRGSCTCSTITWNDYHLAEELRYRLVQAVLTHASEHVIHMQTTSVEAVNNAIAQVIGATNDDIRVRLGCVLGLTPSTAEIVLFPSGSDAELLPLILALIRTQQTSTDTTIHPTQPQTQPVPPNGCVYNYVMAAGEVGSGTPNAAGGRHFSPMSPKSSHPYPILDTSSDVENDGDNDDSKRISALVPGLGSVTPPQPQVNNGLLRGWEGMIKEANGSANNKGRSENAIVVVQYKPRTAEGDVDFQEQQLIADIRTKLGPGPGPSPCLDASELDGGKSNTTTTANSSNIINHNSNNVCVLHVVCGSKTGLVCPSQVHSLPPILISSCPHVFNVPSLPHHPLLTHSTTQHTHTHTPSTPPPSLNTPLILNTHPHPYSHSPLTPTLTPPSLLLSLPYPPSLPRPPPPHSPSPLLSPTPHPYSPTPSPPGHSGLTSSRMGQPSDRRRRRLPIPLPPPRGRWLRGQGLPSPRHGVQILHWASFQWRSGGAGCLG